MTKRRLGLVIIGVILGLLNVPRAASGSEIGQEVAAQISQTSYRHYLDDILYTHNGNNRDGRYGAQHDPCRTNIRNTLQGFGLPVELHPFSYSGTRYNVVATQQGTAHADSYYIIGAHYDSAGTPGADDNASGVAGILEIARILSTYKTEYSIRYIAFDFEEYGLIGSNAWVDEHLDDDIRGMISLDMIAFSGGAYPCNIYGHSSSASIKNNLANAIWIYGGNLAPFIKGQLDASDHAPFEAAGFPACLLIEAGDNNCYHKSCDSVDTAGYIDYAFATDMTRSVAGFLADYALAHPIDCNSNGIDDSCDTHCSAPGCSGVPGCGQSVDCNGNWFPDECEGGDLCPPTNLHWLQQPTPISTTAVTMSAAAEDPSGVEYYFAAVGVGGHHSGWQTNQTYTDSGLEINLNFSYKVKARDQSAQHTETDYTPSVALATFIETPTALSFGAVTNTSIQVTAAGPFTRLNANLSGLYFQVLNPSGGPVGGSQANTWVQSDAITAVGLTPGVTYRFRVKARNYFGANETAWYPASGYVTQMTSGGETCAISGDMNQDGVINGVDISGFVRAKLGAAPGPNENPACANYGGSLDHDIGEFVTDLLRS